MQFCPNPSQAIGLFRSPHACRVAAWSLLISLVLAAFFGAFVWYWYNLDVFLLVSFDAQAVLASEGDRRAAKQLVHIKEQHDYLRLAFPSRFFVSSGPLQLGKKNEVDSVTERR